MRVITDTLVWAHEDAQIERLSPGQLAFYVRWARIVFRLSDPLHRLQTDLVARHRAQDASPHRLDRAFIDAAIDAYLEQAEKGGQS